MRGAPGPVGADVAAVAVAAAEAVRAAVTPHLGAFGSRRVVGRAPGGDATMAIDEVAEQAVGEILGEAGNLAWYTEDRGLHRVGRPRALLVIDPVDGTRPAAAGLEAACVSIAVVPPDPDATLGEVRFGVVLELRSGRRFTAHRGGGAEVRDATGRPEPTRRSPNVELRRLFWTAGQRGRPLMPTSVVLAELVDASSLHGGYFDLGSAAFALTRIVTGQFDAYVDVGRRIVDEHPELAGEFRAVGDGAICVNFPYDVAAGALIVAEAGGVVTAADGRPLDDRPAVGSGPETALAVLAAANRPLHEALLEALDRGVARLGGWLAAGAPGDPSRVPSP
jgi:myo-inositol-1(or 4)-monophosphatase